MQQTGYIDVVLVKVTNKKNILKVPLKRDTF